MNIARGAIAFSLALTLVLPFSFPADPSDLATLLRKADLLLKQEAYQAGIAVLETVLRSDPQNAEALSKLLSAYDTYSQKLVSEDKFNQANAYLEKMAEVTKKIEALPDEALKESAANRDARVKREVASAKTFFLTQNTEEASKLISLNAGRERFNEAVEHYNRHEYDLAEQLLLESIQYDQSNAYAYQLLGDLANLKQDLKKAEAYYREAIAINPDKTMLANFQKIVREQKIDKAQQHYSDEHFIIRYKRGDRFEGFEIRAFLREAYRSISQEFGFYPKNKIPVILYDRDEYLTLMGDIPHWSGAAFDGKIRLPVYVGPLSTKEVKRLIYHELTHSFVFHLSGSRCPIWLNEGLAEYQENKIQPVVLAPLKAAARKKALIDINTLILQDVTQLSSSEDVLIFYLQSFSIVDYLITKYRVFKVKELLTELREGTAFEAAFEKVYLRTFLDFAGDWRKTLG